LAQTAYASIQNKGKTKAKEVLIDPKLVRGDRTEKKRAFTAFQKTQASELTQGITMPLIRIVGKRGELQRTSSGERRKEGNRQLFAYF